MLWTPQFRSNTPKNPCISCCRPRQCFIDERGNKYACLDTSIFNTPRPQYLWRIWWNMRYPGVPHTKCSKSHNRSNQCWKICRGTLNGSNWPILWLKYISKAYSRLAFNIWFTGVWNRPIKSKMSTCSSVIKFTRKFIVQKLSNYTTRSCSHLWSYISLSVATWFPRWLSL